MPEDPPPSDDGFRRPRREICADRERTSPATTGGRGTDRKNVLLLSVDALRRDHLGCYGYHRETSPFIDRLAERSVRFTRVYSVSCHTREAIPALLTGYAPDRAVHRYYRLQRPPVSTYLRAAGYATGAAVTAPFLTAANGYDRGFDTFRTSYTHSRWNLSHVLEYAWEVATNDHYASGEWVNENLLEVLDGADRPAFAWGHYTDAHAPYNRHTESHFGEKRSPRTIQYLFRRAKYWPSSITPEEHRTLVDAYDDGIRELDRWLRDLFERLARRDLLEETIVVVTADHGELFGEHGLYEHRRFLKDDLLHVPLLWYDAHRRPRDRSHKVASIDVPATVCTVGGVDSASLPGRNLFRDAFRPVRTSCIRRGRRKSRVI